MAILSLMSISDAVFGGSVPIEHVLPCADGHTMKVGASIDWLLRWTVAATWVALMLLETQIEYSSEPPAQVAVPPRSICAETQSTPWGGGLVDREGDGDGLADFDGEGDLLGVGLADGVTLDVGPVV